MGRIQYIANESTSEHQRQWCTFISILIIYNSLPNFLWQLNNLDKKYKTFRRRKCWIYFQDFFPPLLHWSQGRIFLADRAESLKHKKCSFTVRVTKLLALSGLALAEEMEQMSSILQRFRPISAILWHWLIPYINTVHHLAPTKGILLFMVFK